MAKKDIFDLFKEKSEQLEQEPSPQAWARIERRIPASRPAVKRARVRQMPQPLSIAAGLALLLGLSVVFMWLSDQGTPSALAQQNVQYELEELSLVVDDESINMVEKAQTHFPTSPSKPIVEGRASQRLVAKNDLRRESPTPPGTPTDTTVNEREQRTGR